MVAIPKEVLDIIKPESVKTLVTVDAAGQPHAVVCGSIMACPVDASKVIVKDINDDIKKVFMMTGFYNLFEIE